MDFSSWCSLLLEIHLQSYPPHLEKVIGIKHFQLLLLDGENWDKTFIKKNISFS